MKSCTFLSLFSVLVLAGVGSVIAEEVAKLPAFPGAEGFGAKSIGGRGGRVIKVTTLEPTGPGSIEQALSAKGPRIIVFEVSGVIKAPRRGKYFSINIREPNVTIAGQTAPGAGITIEGMLKVPYRLKPALHDVTIRFLRIRPPQPVGSGQGGDGVQLTGIDRLILDHCSIAWGNDENVDVCNSRNITIQWCAIEESSRKGHEKGHHNFGMIMGYSGRDASIHHSLFAHHKRRAPLCGLEVLDHRNNVIYNMWSPLNWHPTRMNYQRPGKPFRANIVANYFKHGPRNEGKSPQKNLDDVMSSRGKVHLYQRGNYFAWLKEEVAAGDGPTAEKPWTASPVTTHTAREAYKLVLAHTGCLPRDAVGRRTIKEVRTGTGAWGRREPKGGLMEGMKPAAPPKDTDGDGMPGDWESAHGLNLNDPKDATGIVPKGAGKDDRHAGYTFIEFYINDCADRLIAKALTQAADQSNAR